MKKKIKLFVFLFITFIANAQVSFKVVASKTTVEVGESFELIYTSVYSNMLSSLTGEDAVFPDYKNFIEIGSSESSNISIVNNKTKAVFTITKTLLTTTKGVFTISPAKIIGKKSIATNPITITVTSKKNTTTQNQNITKDFSEKNRNLPRTFAKWVISKNNPYVYEGINLKLRIYTKDVEMLNSIAEVKPPKFEGVTSHILKNEQTQSEIKVEALNGEEYAYVDLQQWIIFPQTTESIPINSAEIGITSYSSFFNNDLSFINSDPITIIAKSLPLGAPKNFAGAVGNFQIKTLIDKSKLKSGESATYEVEIIGNGNLDIIKMPEIILTDSIEIYSPKERQNYTATEDGLKGKIISEYILVPQFSGNQKIQSVEFSYFDPTENIYKTILSEPTILAISGNKEVKDLQKNIPEFSDSSLLDEIKTNKNLILSIFGFIALVLSLYFVLNKKKKTKNNSIEVAAIKTDVETIIAKTTNEKQELNELKQLAEKEDYKLYYEKQDSFINNWLLSKTGFTQSKLTIQTAKEYFIVAGFDKQNIDELIMIINRSKEAKYASILKNNTVDLINVFKQLETVINKF